MATEPETREHLKNAPRIDMRLKVTGSAKYIEDLPEPAGLLYGAVLWMWRVPSDCHFYSRSSSTGKRKSRIAARDRYILQLNVKPVKQGSKGISCC